MALRQLRRLLLCLLILLAACSSTAQIFEAYVTEDGRELQLGVNSCNADLKVEVREDEERVAIRVTVRNDTMDDCMDGVTVALEEPLGERELVDAATGQAVPVRPADE